MTSTQLENYKRYLLTPIAGARASSSLTDIPDSDSDLAVNNGFGDAYSASKLVTRANMNAMFKLATQKQFFRQLGGIETWDSTTCTGIGGYPKGVVLPWMEGGVLHFIRSLTDNNTYDLSTNGVDGVNWEYCLPNEAPESAWVDVNWSRATSQLLYTVNSTSYSSSKSEEITDTDNMVYKQMAAGTFTRKGYVNIKGNLNITYTSSTHDNHLRLVIIIGDNDGTDVSSIIPGSIDGSSKCEYFDLFFRSEYAGSALIEEGLCVSPFIRVEKGANWRLLLCQTNTTINSGFIEVRQYGV